MDLITISETALYPMHSNRMKCADNYAMMTIALSYSLYNSRQKIPLKSIQSIIMRRGIGPG